MEHSRQAFSTPLNGVLVKGYLVEPLFFMIQITYLEEKGAISSVRKLYNMTSWMIHEIA